MDLKTPMKVIARAALSASALRQISARSFSAAAGATASSSNQFANKTIGYILSKKAVDSQHMNALRVVHEKYNWSFEQLKKYSEAFANGLLELGVRRGEKVAYLAPANAENVITQFAAAKLGAAAVALPAIRSAEHFETLVNTVQPTVLVLPSKFDGVDVFAILKTYFPDCETADSTVIRSKKFPSLKKIILTDRDVKGFLLMKRSLIYGPFNYYETPLRINARKIQVSDVASVQAGEDGSVKSSLSQASLVSSGQQFASQTGLVAGSRVLLASSKLSSPLSSVTSFASFLSDATLVLASESFNAEEAVKAITAEQTSVVVGSASEVASILAAGTKLEGVSKVVVEGLTTELSASIKAVNSSAKIFSFGGVSDNGNVTLSAQ